LLPPLDFRKSAQFKLLDPCHILDTAWQRAELTDNKQSELVVKAALDFFFTALKSIKRIIIDDLPLQALSLR
jgi:hypothetical protein